MSAKPTFYLVNLSKPHLAIFATGSNKIISPIPLFEKWGFHASTHFAPPNVQKEKAGFDIDYQLSAQTNLNSCPQNPPSPQPFLFEREVLRLSLLGKEGDEILAMVNLPLKPLNNQGNLLAVSDQ